MTHCELPGWLAWAMVLAGTVVSVGLWLLINELFEQRAWRRHSSDFHGRRMTRAGGTLVGMLAAGLCMYIFLSLTRNYFCGLLAPL